MEPEVHGLRAQIIAAARLNFDQAFHVKLISKIQAIVAAGIASGELRQIDPGVATWVLLGMMYPFFYPVHSQEMAPLPEVIDQMLVIYLDGIRR